MAAMTPERRVVRKAFKEARRQADEVKTLIAPLNAKLKGIDAALRTLQGETCRHPAMKHGSSCGMGWCDCPDCGYSHP